MYNTVAITYELCTACSRRLENQARRGCHEHTAQLSWAVNCSEGCSRSGSKGRSVGRLLQSVCTVQHAGSLPSTSAKRPAPGPTSCSPGSGVGRLQAVLGTRGARWWSCAGDVLRLGGEPATSCWWLRELSDEGRQAGKMHMKSKHEARMTCGQTGSVYRTSRLLRARRGWCGGGEGGVAAWGD